MSDLIEWAESDDDPGSIDGWIGDIRLFKISTFSGGHTVSIGDLFTIMAGDDTTTTAGFLVAPHEPVGTIELAKAAALEWTTNLMSRMGLVRDPLVLDMIDQEVTHRAEEAATGPLPERLAQLLDAIREQGGEWGPARARDFYWALGFECTPQRGAANMQRLAELGYLQRIRPRAMTYKIKEATAPDEQELPGV